MTLSSKKHSVDVWYCSPPDVTT